MLDIDGLVEQIKECELGGQTVVVAVFTTTITPTETETGVETNLLYFGPPELMDKNIQTKLGEVNASIAKKVWLQFREFIEKSKFFNDRQEKDGK
jgi:hypothetical protein